MINLCTKLKNLLLVILFTSLISQTNFAQQTQDLVKGNLIQFNDNGFWCWFQDERAVVDQVGKKLIVGSSAAATGFGGRTRRSADEAVIYDLQTRIPIRYELADDTTSQLTTDDHNAPGLLVRPDGKYIAMYSDHYDKWKNRYRIFEGNSWSPEQAFDWKTMRTPYTTNYTIAYNNLYYLSEEGRMYNFSRANNRSPNFIISDDMGDTWTFGGQLSTAYSNSYNKGYYKYWGNGVDRIDFIFTEQHPRDTLTSIYHGYIKGGKAYKSDGTLVDNNILDTTYLPQYVNFTKVFSNGTKIGNNTFYRCWTADLVRYEDGTVAAIITARLNQFASTGYSGDSSINPDHAFIYCRYDGQNWSYTFLNKAGFKFYASEADYVGLGALAPNDPTTLYISSPYDPRDTATFLPKREIFKGVTNDNGATWTWSSITQNSSKDNFRPIIPAWNKDNLALLWCRGTYSSAQNFNAAVVGLIENKNETLSKMNYVDASSANTTFADGSALVTTGPNANDGPGDSKWHERTGVGNGSSVFTSSEVNGENVPALKTKISFSKDGAYDVWVNFWANTTNDWRIKAGLSQLNMQVFRQMACKQVEIGDHLNGIQLTGSNNEFLYQAYLGRVEKKSGEELEIFVDDESASGNNNILTGNTARTWYDGISYAAVDIKTSIKIADENKIPTGYSLSQNYPNPFNPSTIINYQLPKDGFVSLKVFDVLGREVSTLVNEFQQPGSYHFTFNTLHSTLSSGVYFYTLKVDNSFALTKKMVLIR